MATPSNRVPVRVARGTKASLTASLADLKEGEVCYATDENRLYVIEGGALTLAAPDLSATSVDALSDVDTTTATPTDGQVLAWVNANSQWEPADAVATIDDLTDVDTSTAAPTDGQVLTWDNAGSTWEPATPAVTDASSARTLLGIGEYADDTAAGSGGVASGALYYNTTNSNYVLKS